MRRTRSELLVKHPDIGVGRAEDRCRDDGRFEVVYLAMAQANERSRLLTEVVVDLEVAFVVVELAARQILKVVRDKASGIGISSRQDQRTHDLPGERRNLSRRNIAILIDDS